MNQTPVPVVRPPELPAPKELVCANCGTALVGEYCAACGQRHEPHVHTLRHFAGEAFESVTHADSRLWRTLWFLLSRPGFLTREFFAGRRASYLPPFRLYLVISVVFFLVVGVPNGTRVQVDEKAAAKGVTGMQEAAGVLEKQTGPASEALKEVAAELRREAAKEGAAGESAADSGTKKKEGLQSQNGMTEFCDAFKKPDPRGNKDYARLQAFCAKTAEDGGAELLRSVVHNIPRAMFVFLPLLALAMKLMYWRPRRYYVEHLLFLVHNHAFVFLLLAILTLLKLIPIMGQRLGWVEGFVWLYMIWYLFRAMRNVYQQGRALTLAKYFALGLAYFSAGLTVLLLTVVYSALTFA
jgi:hypothetical protein